MPYLLLDNRGTTSPAINLAIEEYAVRNLKHDTGFVHLYINQPCIVVGKNQCAWREVNTQYLHRHQLPLYRRVSGGGTVYHDPGNLNYSFIVPHTDSRVNSYKEFLQPIMETLSDLGIESYMSPRNDLKVGERKISGTAQFTNRRNILTHGTLLVNANLTELSASLQKNPKRQVVTKAIESVSSPVANIGPMLKGGDVSGLQQLIADKLCGRQTYHFNDKEWAEVLELAEKYESWQWRWARSPKCSIKNELEVESQSWKSELQIEDGLITKAEISIPYWDSSGLQQELSGMKYEPNTITDFLKINEPPINGGSQQLLNLLY